MKRILIVEDEMDIQELLSAYLRDAGYAVQIASDGMEAIDNFNKYCYDLVLLDIMLPKIDGFGVCELIRRKSKVPIIMLTALDNEKEQIRGFDLEIDDYVTKPFSMPVLLRKIAAVLRRTNTVQSNNIIEYKELKLDTDAYEVKINDTILDLTQREYELLFELLKNQGRVLTREVILAKLWGYDFYGDDRIVDSHIKNLRKKLGLGYVETVRGVGYRVAKEAK
ncbi:MAG TPA: DNA-binding response regulator [Clostridiales bacterium]|nr:DNA-binding response regulator [Clostridiales bacterium]